MVSGYHVGCHGSSLCAGMRFTLLQTGAKKSVSEAHCTDDLKEKNETKERLVIPGGIGIGRVCHIHICILNGWSSVR